MKLIRILVLSLMFPATLVAQQPHDQFYSIENLFTQELIKAIAKDGEGYLWIATDNGALRYDGFETKLYKELSNRYVKAFLKSKTGKFFVLHDAGILEIVNDADSVYFKPLTIGKNIYDTPLNYPKSIYEDQDGNLWVGEMNALVRFNESGMKRYELGEAFRSINYHRTFSFAEDAFGNLWVAPFKGPLLYYEKKSQELKKANVTSPITDVCGIACVKGDFLLLGGKEGILKLKVDSDKNILASDFIRSIPDVSVIVNYGKTESYIGTWTNGLFYLDIEKPASAVEKLSHVPVHDVLGIYPDASRDELWITGSEHIGLFKTTPVSSVPSIGQNRIESLTLDNQDGVYYSIGGQVFYLAKDRGQPVKEILSATDTYFARILIEKDNLWLGNAFGGIAYFDLKSRLLHPVLKEASASIQYVHRDSRGNKWFTGHPRGLIKIDLANRIEYYETVTSSVVTRESGNGKLYCGRNGRNTLLSVYDTELNEFLPVPLDFQFTCPDNIILNDFQFDSLENIWLATEEGVLKIPCESGAYKRVERITISGFRESESYKAIAITDNFIYLTNSFGLIIYKNGEYIAFNQHSGLPSKILKERGLIVNRNGDLLIATAKGMAFFSSSLIAFKPTILPVFKNMMINGNRITPEKEKTYAYPYNTRIDAEFITLSFPSTNIVYQTKISGVDSDWSAASSGRNVNILGVSEGTYILHVRAREDGKLWSEPLSFQFTIARPWYRTWWAILLFATVAILGVMIYVKVHNNNLIRQKRNLEQLVQERTEEVNRQKNELIRQQQKIIQQKQEIIEKNEAVYKSQQALTEADINYMQLKEKQLQEQIEYKNKQVTTHALNIIQKNETLKGLRDKLEEIVKKPERITVVELRRTLRIIDESFKLDKDWDDFKLYFEQVHNGFYAKLKVNYPDLTTQELRHCALIRLNLTISECASILGISHDSAKVSRTRLRKKLHLDPSQSITDFILGL